MTSTPAQVQHLLAVCDKDCCVSIRVLLAVSGVACQGFMQQTYTRYCGALQGTGMSQDTYWQQQL